jgi:Zn-dependent protease with chaperone function
VKLENRAPAEGINASRENPLKELAWLLVGSVAAVMAIIVALSLGAQWIAPRIPLQLRGAPAASCLVATAPIPEQGARSRLNCRRSPTAWPPAWRCRKVIVRVGWRDDRIVNAYATIGGQMVFFGGLLKQLGSEDALAMVMAHELAHLKYRHASAALGRGVAVGVILSVVSAELGRNAAGGLLNQAGIVTLLSFSRDQERAADEAALRAVAENTAPGGRLRAVRGFPAGGSEVRATGAVEFPARILSPRVPRRESSTGPPRTSVPTTGSPRRCRRDCRLARGDAMPGFLTTVRPRCATGLSSASTQSAIALRAPPVAGCTGTTRRRWSLR